MNEETIVIAIKFHGEVLDQKLEDIYDKETLKDIYWHSFVPINGCINYNPMNIFIINTLFDIYKNNYKNKSSHKEILNLYSQNYDVLTYSIPYIINVFNNILKECESMYINNPYEPLKDIIEYLQLYIPEIEEVYNGNIPSIYDKLHIVLSISEEMKGYLSQISNFEESELFKNLSETIKNFRKLLAHYNDTKTKKNKFLHIKYNKSYEYDKKNKDMNKTFGVYVVYDSMRRLDNIDILPPIYGEPGVNFDLANLIYFLKANGYKNIYIYDLSCNFSDKINRESNELLGSPVTSSSDVAMEI